MALLMHRAQKLFDYATLNAPADPAADDNSSKRPKANAGCRRRSLAAFFFVCLVVLVVVLVTAGGKSVGSEEEEDSTRSRAGSGLPRSFSSATAKGAPADLANRSVTLEDVTSAQFEPQTFNASWISDHELLFPDTLGGLSIMNVADGNVTQMLSANLINSLSPIDWSLSADKKYLLLKRTSFPVFRRSSYGRYSILQLKDGRPSSTIFDLRPTSMPHMMTNETYDIRLVEWAPVGNGIAYVDYQNNLYVRRAVEADDVKLTHSGVPDQVYHGIPDWVFEEEVFEDNKALWWSPDGKKIVWATFNDSDVDFYILPIYGQWKNIVDPYPLFQQVRYPKVNTTNPKAQLWMADLSEEVTVYTHQVQPPLSLTSAKQKVHFLWVTWIDESRFAVSWANRVQNHTSTTMCIVRQEQSCTEIFFHMEPNGWIDFLYRLVFEPVVGSSDFVTILPSPHVKHRFGQVALVSNGKTTFLTKTEGSEVTEILLWSKDDLIYYVATLPDRPGSRHLYRIRNKSKTECLTCGEEKQRQRNYLGRRPCSYFKMNPSKEGSFFIMECLGPDIPWSAIHHTKSGKFLGSFESNRELEKSMMELDLPTSYYIQVPVDGTDQKVQVQLYLPVNFDAEKKYPLLVYVYGGPGFQSVSDKWNQYDYQTYMSGTHGVVYAILDPQGSGQQGRDWLHSVYRRFGTVEVDSVIQTIKYLINSLTYIHKDKVAIWGWSYGGYVALSVLTNDQDNIFKCGASVAPVSDWRLYDTYYTERYMGLLDDNLAGYNSSSVFPKLDRLRNKRFYLLHGTHDDNVHFQQSMLLSAALEEKNILFRQQAYPDQAHGILKYRLHLYHSLTEFFMTDCFAH